MTPARTFYVTQAIALAALWLALLLPRPQPSISLALCCLAGATMQALTAICGLAFYWDKGPAPARAGGPMCDAAHPQIVAWVTIAACATVLFLVTREPRGS